VYEVELDTRETDMCEREPLEPDYFKEVSPKKAPTIIFEDDENGGLSSGLTNEENDKADIFELKEAKQSSDTIASDAQKREIQPVEPLAVPKIEAQSHCEQNVQRTVWMPPQTNPQSAISSSARLLPPAVPEKPKNQDIKPTKLPTKSPIDKDKPDVLKLAGSANRNLKLSLDIRTALQIIPNSSTLTFEFNLGHRQTRAKCSVPATPIYKSYEEPINFSDVRKPTQPFTDQKPEQLPAEVNTGKKLDRKTTWKDYNAGTSIHNFQQTSVITNHVSNPTNPLEPKKSRVHDMYKRGARQPEQTVTNITVQKNEYITVVHTDAIDRGLYESSVSNKPDHSQQPLTNIAPTNHLAEIGFSSIQESGISLSAPKDLANETPEETAARKKREALHRRRRHKEVEIEDLPLPGAIFIPPAQFGGPTSNHAVKPKLGASNFEVFQQKKPDESSSFSIESKKNSSQGRSSELSMERKELNLPENKFDLRDSIMRKAGIESLDPNFKKSYK